MLELQLQWSEKEEHPDVKRSGITSGQLAHRDKFGARTCQHFDSILVNWTHASGYVQLHDTSRY